jgi:ATP/maltotriose-dependent transcriptional regulator MalT
MDAVAVVAGSPEHWMSINARAVAVAREIGWLAGEAYAEILAGEMLGPRGDAGEALARAGAGIALAERIGHRQWIAFGHYVVGRIQADLLDTVPAREHLESALSQAHDVGSRFWARLSTAALGSLLVDLREFETAAAVLEAEIDAGRPADSIGLRACWLSWARLCVARGEPEQALRAIERLMAGAPDTPEPRSVPWIALARGDARAALGRVEEAEADHGAARLGALDLGYRHLLWRADLALCRLLHGTGRLAEACAARDRALASVQDIAATLSSGEQRQSFQRRALARFPALDAASSAPPLPGGLSRREIEVLRLVAQGFTDAEVAARLSISPRTVGRHLQSVYNKIGVGSRTAAVAFAFEHDLVDRPRAG